MAKSGEVNAKQKKVIAALIASPTIGAACETAGIGRSTLRRWLQDETFTKALADETRVLLGESTRRLVAGQGEALDTLAGLMRTAESESVRLSAAVNWLAISQKLVEWLDLEERVTKLEAQKSE